MSTYSPNLRIELIDSGTQAGVWGTTTNTNLGTLIEQSISGYVSVSITAASQALTAVNGATDQSRMAMVNLTTTTTAAFSVFVPPSAKQYTFKNSSAYTATIYCSTVLGNTTAGGTGIVVPNGAIISVWSDGANIYLQNQNSVTPTAGTNDTKVATTAFVASAITTAAQFLYPVGSIYMNANVATNPVTLLGFGTWTAFGGGRVPVGYLASDPLFGTAGNTGGVANTPIITHTHAVTMANTNHTHTFSTGGHQHYIASACTYNSYNPNSGVLTSGNYMVQMVGGGGSADEKYILVGAATAPTVGLTSSTGTSGTTDNPTYPTALSASTSTPTGAVAGTNQNYQPYITVYMWQRTA